MNDKDWVIAGIWRRIIGGLIDIVCLLAFVYCAAVLTGLSTQLAVPLQPNTLQQIGRPLMVWFLVGFILLAICEYFFGRTLGKVVTFTRVVNADFSPITAGQALIRNLFRVVDAFGLGLVGLVCLLCNHKHQRVGDLAARTYVVRRSRK